MVVEGPSATKEFHRPTVLALLNVFSREKGIDDVKGRTVGTGMRRVASDSCFAQRETK